MGKKARRAKAARKEKVRMKTEEELTGYARGMQEFATVLSRYEMSWFLGCGALLGAYRDGDLIPWDWDVEFEAKAEEASSYMRNLVKDLRKEGFKQIRTDRKGIRIRCKKYGCRYLLRLWKKEGEFRYLEKNWKLPDYFFRALGKIELRGNQYPCPVDIEGYLTWKYGNWRTPIRAADGYNTKDYHTG